MLPNKTKNTHKFIADVKNNSLPKISPHISKFPSIPWKTEAGKNANGSILVDSFVLKKLSYKYNDSHPLRISFFTTNKIP